MTKLSLQDNTFEDFNKAAPSIVEDMEDDFKTFIDLDDFQEVALAKLLEVVGATAKFEVCVIRTVFDVCDTITLQTVCAVSSQLGSYCKNSRSSCRVHEVALYAPRC